MPARQYRVKGKRVPGVTTILGKFKDPGALMWWSWNIAYTQLQQATHLLEEPEEKTIQAFLRTKPLEKGNYRSASSAAATAGTLAHDLVEMWIHAGKTERDNLQRRRAQTIQRHHRCTIQIAESAHKSFHGFLDWMATNKFKLKETEIPLVSEKHGFGGTIDCIGKIGRQFCLFDWKSSNRVYADYILQIAAYGILWEENHSTHIDSYHLCRFDKTTGDFQHHQWTNLRDGKYVFLLLKEAYDRLKLIEKRI